MITSLLRIVVIGRNTLTESVRQKVLSVLLIFAVVLVGCSVGISQLATPGLDTAGMFTAQIKFVKDFGCGAIGFFGFFIALLSTAQLIPQELHNRTIYTILAKPVRRSEFILGKFVGIVLLLALCVALMSLAFSASLYWQESVGIRATEDVYSQGIPNWDAAKAAVAQHDQDIAAVMTQPGDDRSKAEKIKVIEADYGKKMANWEPIRNAVAASNREVTDIKRQIRDPQLIEAIILLFAKLLMTSGIALLISTFATSSIFTIITTFLIYLIGHMESTARIFWLARGAETTIWQNGFVGLISLLVPDMNSFTIVDEILAGNHVPWAHALNLLGYSEVYLIVLLAVSIVIFDYREI